MNSEFDSSGLEEGLWSGWK